MKKFKRIMALVIALAMVLSMGAMTALADDNTTSTLTTDTAKNDGEFKIELSSAEDGHTFKAYRIFDGSVATIDGDITLGDISWATGVTTSGIAAELETAGLDKTLGGTLSAPNLLDFSKAPDVAKAMALQQDDSAVMIAVADVFYDHKGNAVATATEATDGKYTLSPLVAGYYLVTDEYTSTPAAAGAETLSRNIMAVVADVAAEVKNDKPTVDKKIVTDGTTTKADANSANIGETVVYEIEGKVPNYTGYDKYFYVINDTLSNGLTFNGASNVVVTIEDAATQPVAGTDYIVYVKDDATNPADSPYTFQVAFKNIKNYTIGKKITVRYSATVNENAEVGSTGNPNTTNVIYSNNPNDSSSGNPSTTPKPTNDIPTGISADEKTVTYVAELDLTKFIDSVSGANLAGAQFTLTGTSTVVEGTTTNKFVADNTNGTYYLLNDGTYTTSVPHGEIKNSDGTVAVESNESSYSSTTQKYSLQGETAYGTDTKDVFMQATTGSNGKISFKGLGAGTYTITETVTPKGYTTADPIVVTFTVTVPTTISTGEEKATWASSNADVVVNGTSGVYETNVIDFSGSVLPSTGGIGTTIFYVVGAILVIGAGVIMITRRRMDA